MPLKLRLPSDLVGKNSFGGELAPQERYLYKPFLGSSHHWALSFIRDFSPTARVLDVGPGSGAIGTALKERGIGELYAVEVDERAREHVAPIYKRVEATLEGFAGEKFDRVLLLDVLEHMDNPAAFLKALREFLSPGAELLVSVPNVAHWSVRLLLLFGYFPYYNRGILDCTHLQFFTRGRIKKILGDAGFTTVSEAASIPPVEFVLPRPLWDNPVYAFLNKLHHGLAQILPGFWGYQLLTRVHAGVAACRLNKIGSMHAEP